LVEGGSRAGQGSQSKQVTMQDQATSPIMIEDDDQSNSVGNRTPENQANSNDEICATNTQDNLENQSNVNSGDDTNVQENESQSRRNSSRRWTFPKITRKQEKFQALLQELSTPAKGEKAEN
ncbi:3209_t:CDS:2, partial [Funneliformis caledonium]